MTPIHGCVFLALVALVAACDSQDAGKNTQDWAARVNAGGVTSRQIDFELAQNPKLRQADPDAVGKLVVRQLAQQELLAQKATEAKLDKDATVALALDSARRRVLAQAYLEKAAATVPAPTTQEAETLHKDYLELFEDRRVFQFDELIATAKNLDIKELERRAATKPPLMEIAKWLQSLNTGLQGGRIAKSSEQIPLDKVKSIHQMHVGDIVLTPTGKDRISIAQLVAVQPQPISADKINLAAQQYLLANRRQTFLLGEVKKLVENAKIEYLGNFAELNAHKAEPVELPTPEKSSPTADAPGP